MGAGAEVRVGVVGRAARGRKGSRVGLVTILGAIGEVFFGGTWQASRAEVVPGGLHVRSEVRQWANETGATHHGV